MAFLARKPFHTDALSGDPCGFQASSPIARQS